MSQYNVPSKYVKIFVNIFVKKNPSKFDFVFLTQYISILASQNIVHKEFDGQAEF